MASFGIGYKLGSDGKESIQKKLEKEKVEKELVQNKLDSIDHFNKHNAIEDAIKRGSLFNGSGRAGDGTNSDGM